jgi:DNA polymerase-1
LIAIGTQQFDEVWLVDFEFQCPDGELPRPICLVARELASGRVLRVWESDLRQMKRPPYPTGRAALFVSYYSSAELGCHLALGWPMPENVLDLYVEFRNLTNGRPVPCGTALLGALAYFGLDAIEGAEKESMRELAMRGGPWSEEERRALLLYCETDVDALARLLPPLLPAIDVPRALLRGRYMKAAARIERVGVPVDVSTFERIKYEWSAIQGKLIEEIDRDFGVYDGSSFRAERWERWLTVHGIPWPRLPSGKLALDDETFRQMARAHPEVAPIRELRCSLSELRLQDLAVGADGRNRCLLSAFRSRTGRNQPSNSKFIFGPAVWIRGLIQPRPGFGVAYVDWSQQEFGIAAGLSGDSAMLSAYASADPYLALAKQSGAVPPSATKKSHGAIREQFKQCVLGVQYAMGAESLAARINQPTALARELLDMHHRTYPVFWRWSDSAVDHAMLKGYLWTTFGWTIHTSAETNARSLRNFPMQANGAEMLRLACSFATERGIRICAPVHDAVLVEAPLEDLHSVVDAVQAAMVEASRAVLDGFELRSDAKVFLHPERYADERGHRMWNTVMRLVEPQRQEAAWHPCLSRSRTTCP